MKTAATMYSVSEEIVVHLHELVKAISKLPSELQNSYAVSSAALLLGVDDAQSTLKPASAISGVVTVPISTGIEQSLRPKSRHKRHLPAHAEEQHPS